MSFRSSGALALALVFAVFACGSEEAANTASDPASPATTPKPAPNVSTSPDAATGDAGLSTDSLVGLWEVEGTDGRGKYTGEMEVRGSGTGSATYTFIRNVRYAGVTVEDGRELHWLFRGKLTRSGAAESVTLGASLKRIDFIAQRGSVTRTAADAPIALAGSFTLKGDTVSGTITGTGVAITDTWRARKPLPASPIFEDKRTIVPAHDPPTATDIATRFALYGNYHTLDVVKPYVGRAEFKAAIHGHVIDTTDLDFYRKTPNALRVVDKVIDEVSLGETRSRADAYRYTLAQKADLYDKDVENRFIDPDIGMIPDNGGPGAGYAGQGVSGDSTLWTGIYLGGQVYRAQVTGSAKAKENVVRSLNALLTLQEITNDWKQFARTLRKATGNPQKPWHAGTGQFAQFEWMEGGNNDMIKGLFYGYLMSWELLCEGGKTGYESYCARIHANAKHLADDIVLGGSNAPAAQYTNKLPAAWLAAVTADDLGTKLSYQSTATTYWSVAKAVLMQTADSSFQGQVDASGMHLSSVGNLVAAFLAKRMNLGGDAVDKYRAYIDLGYANIGRFRLPEWDLLAAIAGTGAGTAVATTRVTNAVSRMQEAMYPKLGYDVDHRISPEFCMSPYPYQPWKQDWMTYPQSDRTSGLNSYPLFESRPDLLYWKVGNSYRGSEGYESAGSDFTHLYWQARKFNLITATE